MANGDNNSENPDLDSIKYGRLTSPTEILCGAEDLDPICKAKPKPLHYKITPNVLSLLHYI